jgi:hypothetical protein
MQMCLVISTQARLSTFLIGHGNRDDGVRLNVEGLGKTVQWRMTASRPIAANRDTTLPNRTTLQRGASTARQKRRDWRASDQDRPGWTSENLDDMFDTQAQTSATHWAGQDGGEDDDDVTPGQSFYGTGHRSLHSVMTSTMASTITDGASTFRGGDRVFQSRTPQTESFRQIAETQDDLTPNGPSERR